MKISRLSFAAGLSLIFSPPAYAHGAGILVIPVIFGAFLGTIIGVITGIKKKEFKTTIRSLVISLVISGLVIAAWEMATKEGSVSFSALILMPFGLLIMGIIPGILGALFTHWLSKHSRIYGLIILTIYIFYFLFFLADAAFDYTS